MDVTAATRGHDGERVPMWSLVSRYMVVKMRSDLLMEQTLVSV